ncbi:zinc finger CCCH domain-containing protein 14 isoform X2 [Hetaerina americana]
MVMVANNRTKIEMVEDLQLFLGTHTEKFISWLLQVLQKLQEVTLASLDARKATSSGLDKEKAAKKRKIPGADGDVDSAKRDRKKKVEVTKKDLGGKKGKKGLKNKSGKLEAVKAGGEKRLDESVNKEKKEAVMKPKEKASGNVTKTIPLNLPTASRANPKPVLMVSDEDDEDFINIRADAEAADLLVSELQEEIRMIPQKQSVLGPALKVMTSVSQQLPDRSVSGSRQSPSLLPVQDVLKESVVLGPKDVRLKHANEGGTAEKEVKASGGWHKPESPVVGTSSLPSSSHAPQSRAVAKSSELLSSRLPSVRRTPAIPPPEGSSRNSLASSFIQAEPNEKRHSDETHVQPTSKVMPVSRVGSIKSRLGKRPGAREESRVSLGPVRAVGVTSVVRVKGRPKVPLAAQANKNLILKAVAEAQKSVASAPIRVEPQLRNPGLLTRKNRENSSKIAVTLPNPRVTSHYDQEGWSSQDEVNHPKTFENKPKIMVQLFQNQKPPVQNCQQQPIHAVSGLLQNQAQTIQSQDQLIHTQRLLVQTQAQLLQSQPQSGESPSRTAQSPPNLMQNQPQPDLVASLHDGMSSQSSLASAGGNIVEDVILNDDGNGVISLSQPRNLMNAVTSEVEDSRIMEGVDESQQNSQNVGRTSGHLIYSEGNEVGPTMICSIPEETPIGIVERQVPQTTEETLNEARASSPQFFVTLSGYDPCTVSGAGRVVRSDLGVEARCFLPSGVDECLDEGIGEEDSKESMQEGELIAVADTTASKDKRAVTHSSGSVIFRTSTLNVSDIVESSAKPKNVERCRFWPACRHGERCEYHHPTIPCKAFPSCKFGDKCLYIHPNCKFDAACTRKDCPFTHALPRSIVAAPVPPPTRFPPRPMAVQCRFFPKCTNVNCKFYHPKPCRFGNGCNKYDCPYMHEREPIPAKEKLKWVCPTKA